MQIYKHYVNLTNGIEAIPDLKNNNIPYSFIRIQSSQCEAKNWMKMLMGLDNDFLMSCALGYDCIVYDYSQKRDVPRALYQGLELVKYLLNRRWYNIKADKVPAKGDCDQAQYFDIVYKTLFVWNQTKEKNDLKIKLDYFKKFLLSDQVHISYSATSTTHDGDYDYYKDILKKYSWCNLC